MAELPRPLLHSDDPVTSIGRAVGWPDQNYFARRFRAHYGLSATTYRRQFATQGAEEPPRRHVTLTGLDQDDAAAAAQAG
jgi:AraC-like DNA-binding protein